MDFPKKFFLAVPQKNHALLPFMNRRFTLVVISCPWNIEAQVAAGVQITLAKEKFSLLKINNDKKNRSFFLHIRQQKKNFIILKMTGTITIKNKTEINKNIAKNLNKQRQNYNDE
jgi:hypothetical protein